MPTLQEELNQFLQNVMQQVPAEVLTTSSHEMDKIEKEQMPTGLSVGDIAPNFSLPDPVGNIVSLADLLREGPVVLSFYRGAWCPYCNLELRALQAALPEFTKRNAKLVAISPQTPDHSLSVQEKHNLAFPVLSDPTGETLRAYHLLFEFSKELRELYENAFQIDVGKYNGDLGWKLPVPATYILDTTGKIVALGHAMDYTKRMNIEDILAALDQIQ